MIRYTGRGKRRSRVLPVLTLAAAVAAVILLTVAAKGMAVVEGRLQLRDWTDKDGGKRRSAEVVAEHVYFGDSKQRSESDTASAPPASGDFREIPEDEEGELPF